VKKIINERQWTKCDLCGKSIANNEECFEIEYKKRWGYKTRYRNVRWHLKHFLFKDHSVKCKIKMECATNNKSGDEMGCEKRLCIHFREKSTV
jgi:hypothetical protein